MKRRNVLIDLNDNKTLEILARGFRRRDEESGIKIKKGFSRRAYFWWMVLLRACTYAIVSYVVYNYFLNNPTMYRENISDIGALTLSGGIVVSLVAIFIFCYLMTERLRNIGYSEEEISNKFWPLYLFSFIYLFVGGFVYIFVWLIEAVLLRFTSRIRPAAAYFSHLWLLFALTDEKYRRAILNGEYSDEEIEEVYLDNIQPTQTSVRRGVNNSIDEIRELNELFEEGIITKEEFEKKKKKILDI